MIICIGEEEFDVEALISQQNFELVKMDPVIAGLIQYRDTKAQTLTWLKELYR